ncbi:MAG: hypothetical protein HUJ54_14415, partial [Erysipelotrichaceae bacterium]|nr:hypothetical protein [Erysipelotrichaceae bacterium]
IIYLTYDCPERPLSVSVNGSPIKIGNNIYALEFGLMGDEPLAVYYMGVMMIIIPTFGSAETRPFSLTTPAFTEGMSADEAGLKTVVSPAEAVFKGCEFMDQNLNSADSYSESATPWIQYTYTVLTKPSSVTVNGKEVPLVKSLNDYLKYADGDSSYGLYSVGQLQLTVRTDEKPAESIDVSLTANQPSDGMSMDEFAKTLTISPKEQKFESGSFLSEEDGYFDTYKAGNTDWAVLGLVLTAEPGSISLNGTTLKMINVDDEQAVEEALKNKESFAVESGTAVLVFDYCPSECSHVSETIKGKDPTCTEPGLTDGEKCSKCGAVLKAQKEIPAADHKEAILKGKEPTCTEPGLTEGKECSVCHEVLKAQAEIPAAGHKETVQKGKEPTCTEPGLTDGLECSVCHEILKAQEEIPAAHQEAVLKGTEPTCTEPGLTDGFECSVCHEILKAQEEIPAAHKEAVLKGKNPTCTEPGLTEGKECSVCHEVLKA